MVLAVGEEKTSLMPLSSIIAGTELVISSEIKGDDEELVISSLISLPKCKIIKTAAAAAINAPKTQMIMVKIFFLFISLLLKFELQAPA